MMRIRKLSRRSFLGQVAGGAAGAGALAVVGARPAGATQSECSDSDTGLDGDPAGSGLRCTPTGVTDSDPADTAGSGRGSNCSDSDTGRNADPVRGGRRCGGNIRTGVSDSDSGSNGDPVNYGRREQACSDRDSGRGADPVQGGQRCRGRGWTGVTDADRGANADPANYGRRGGTMI